MSRLADLDLFEKLTPSQLIAGSFALAIIGGTFLLSLPIAHASERVGVLDALFTATSAICVTGLVVVDTGTAFSGFGQFVIMMLFQLGGLGVLTFGTFLALATGRRIGVGTQLQLQQQVNAVYIGDVVGLVKAIARIVLIAEGIGVVGLYSRFAAVEGPVQGVYYAIFHSISAFNNAGFSLYPDSLTRFVADPIINVFISGLIIAGGLGFTATINIRQFLRRGGPRVALTLHTKMALAMTAFLIAFGMVVIMVIEWTNPDTIGALDVVDRLWASLFASVTSRTAGFNSIDYGEMSSASLLLTMLLMFIGGSPGSTAGGIKTVTFFVLAVSIWSVLRGKPDAVIFGRRLTIETVVRAGGIAFGAVMAGGAALTLLALIEPDLPFIALMFEAISALGTVGLSTGITAQLGPTAKYVIIGLMYLGRIGFLTFALVLVQRQSGGRVRRLAEEVVIG